MRARPRRSPSSRSSPTWTSTVYGQPQAAELARQAAELEVLADLDAGAELARQAAELEVLADLDAGAELARQAAAIAELEVLADLDAGAELARQAAELEVLADLDVHRIRSTPGDRRSPSSRARRSPSSRSSPTWTPAP